MIFSSLFFICIFLPVTLLFYYMVPFKLKNFALLIFSLVFYAWGEPVYIFLMIFSILFNYICAREIGLYRKMDQKTRKKGCFIFCVIINIALLSFFKYYGFFLSNINGIFGTDIPIMKIALPIGISFYTFQALSYVIDVYWGNVPVQKNIINFGTYITMFPQLIAGPIVRYADIERQLKKRNINLVGIADGAAWFIRGLGKKVLLANNAGLIFDAVFAIAASERAALTTWVGIIAYTFQIYFDFSGYSDMAIGLGKMLGFKFVKNFDYPYTSRSATEFWRRWHISLGTWFRKYVYIPLGGNKCGIPKHIRNIMVVWLLTGFWHGAAWPFVLWGIYWGILLLLEKFIYGKGLAKLPAVIQHIYSVLVFVMGWLIFTATSVKDLGMNFASMFGLLNNGLANSTTGYFFTTGMILLIICGFCSTPLVWNLFRRLQFKAGAVGKVVAMACYALILLASIACLVNAGYNPFLYFRF